VLKLEGSESAVDLFQCVGSLLAFTRNGGASGQGMKPGVWVFLYRALDQHSDGVWEFERLPSGAATPSPFKSFPSSFRAILVHFVQELSAIKQADSYSQMFDRVCSSLSLHDSKDCTLERSCISPKEPEMGRDLIG
jgi:hypothetical protein